MFNEEQFDHLHSLWDGKSTTPQVCVSCGGACCNYVEKSLIPGEYEYLVKKTGQLNGSWCSKGCLCDQIKIAKPVICKLYPMQILVDMKGFKVLKTNQSGGYSHKCIDIKFKMKKVVPFLDFLFSDVENRIYWMLAYTLRDTTEYLQKDFKTAGFKIGDHESSIRTIFSMCSVPYDDLDYVYKKEITDEIVYEKTY